MDYAWLCKQLQPNESDRMEYLRVSSLCVCVYVHGGGI